MLEHRFRHLIAQPVPATVSSESFVMCPCAVLAGYTTAQQAYVADAYRIAREMTLAQLRPPVRSGIPAFSMN